MIVRSSDLQSDSDLDSIYNSCDVYYFYFRKEGNEVAFVGF